MTAEETKAVTAVKEVLYSYLKATPMWSWNDKRAGGRRLKVAGFTRCFYSKAVGRYKPVARSRRNTARIFRDLHKLQEQLPSGCKVTIGSCFCPPIPAIVIFIPVD